MAILQRFTFSAAAVCGLLFLFSGTSFAQSGSPSGGDLKTVEPIQAVFDIRVKTPKALASHLDLINDTFEDPAFASLKARLNFVVIFMGQAVKFISGPKEGDSKEDKEHLDAIAAMIPALSANGIQLEACMFAVNSYGVDPDQIPAEIKKVKNGWVSSILYQRQGYSLISDF